MAFSEHAFGLLDQDSVVERRLQLLVIEIDIFGDWIGGEVRADPLYDPRGERVRA